MIDGMCVDNCTIYVRKQLFYPSSKQFLEIKYIVCGIVKKRSLNVNNCADCIEGQIKCTPLVCPKLCRGTNYFYARNTCTIAHMIYSWIANQLGIGASFGVVISRLDFKSETSFGFLSSDYTGQSTCFCKT